MNRLIRRLLIVLACALSAASALLALSAAGAAAGQNMLANSSFEIGIDHRYAMGRWYVNGLPSFSLDDTTKVHGTANLRAPFSVKGYRLDGPYGVELRAGAPVKVEKGKTYTVSVADFEDNVFDRWETGGKSRSTDIKIESQHEEVIAHYAVK